MIHRTNSRRRGLLGKLALLLVPSLAITEALRARSAGLALLSESDPAAQAQQYVTDASRAKSADAGANCANCSLYSAANDGAGGCTLFPGKLVKAAGWCRAWSGL
jgi:High potential iron-sulfur protein